MGPEGVGRAFVALPAPAGLKELIAEARRPWLALGAEITWADPRIAHVTLRFLGRAPRTRVEALDHALHGVAEGAPPLVMTPSETGAFPGWSSPKILWLGLAADGLAELSVAVERAARAAGFDPEARPFRAHVTLGRVKGPSRMREAAELVRAWRPAGEPERVDEMVLYRSDTERHGPRYTPLARYILSGGTT